MPSPSENLFRKAALERLSSPEQLDQLVSLTSARGWLAGAALGVLSVAAIAWSILGIVPTTVSGSGILVSRGGRVFDAMSSTAGTLLTVADIGATVHRGDILATLDDTSLRQDLGHGEAVVRERQAEAANLTEDFDRQIALERKSRDAQKANLQRIIDEAQQRATFYRGLLDREGKIVSQGFITQRSMEETRRSMEDADQEARHSRTDLLHLDAQDADLVGKRDLTLLSARQAVSEAQRRVDELQSELQQASRVVSPLDGIVTEIKTSPGTVVAAGRPIVSIEASGAGLELLLYVPPEFGKKVSKGMEVEIEPATVKKEEYGAMLGRVTSVSDFPMTSEGMMSTLQNPELVSRFMAGGPPYALRVSLDPAPATPSGYAWTGGTGPPAHLSSGTTAQASVTIGQQAPITFLLPGLKRRDGVAT